MVSPKLRGAPDEGGQAADDEEQKKLESSYDVADQQNSLPTRRHPRRAQEDGAREEDSAPRKRTPQGAGPPKRKQTTPSCPSRKTGRGPQMINDPRVGETR